MIEHPAEKRSENDVADCQQHREGRVELGEEFTGKELLTERRREREETAGDDAVDQKDAEYLLNFLTRGDVDYAMKALRLNNTALKTDESQLVQNISLGELAKGIEQIRGIQLDIFGLKENGLSAVSTAESAKTDFVNSVYSTGGIMSE